MLSPDEEYLTIEDASNQLYDRISEYYTLQIQAIGPEEYAFIQKTIKYPESYEEHIANLKSGIRPENETRDHITEFITKYKEFTHPQYVAILDYVIKVLITNPEKARQAGVNALLSLQQKLEAEGNTECENVPEQSTSNIPEFIPFQIEHETIELPSYQDPLMVSLYSVCMMSFSMRMQSAAHPNSY